MPPDTPSPNGRLALLEALRARLWAGDGVAEAARACGVSRDRAKGLINRWGRGEPPEPAVGVVLHAPASGCCHFPLTDGRPWRFCPERRQPGRMYCAAHLRICVQGHARPETWLR